MNRAQALQVRLYECICKIEAGEPLHIGERRWVADLLQDAASGKDIRPAVGFRVRQGAVPFEKPFFVSLQFRALRKQGYSRQKAIAECASTWQVAESTVTDYIKLHARDCAPILEDWGAEKCVQFTRCKARWHPRPKDGGKAIAI